MDKNQEFTFNEEIGGNLEQNQTQGTLFSSPELQQQQEEMFGNIQVQNVEQTEEMKSTPETNTTQLWSQQPQVDYYSQTPASDQQPFGSPMPGNFQNQGMNLLPENPKKSKKWLLILGIVISVIVLLSGTVAGAYFLLLGNTEKKHSSQSSPDEISKKENNIQAGEISFQAFKGLYTESKFTLKDIKRDVKVNANTKKAVVYVFDVENKSDETIKRFWLKGLTNEKALVSPVDSYTLGNSTILEDNSCDSSEKTVIGKGETKKVCLVYPTAVNMLLVPEASDTNKYSEKYKSIKIDDTKSTVSGNEKKLDVDTEIWQHVSSEQQKIKVGKYKIMNNNSKEEVLAVPITLTVGKDSEYFSPSYNNVLIELEEGVFARVEYSGASDDEYISRSSVTNKKNVKKGEIVKYYETFFAKKAVRVYFETFNYTVETQHETFYFNF